MNAARATCAAFNLLTGRLHLRHPHSRRGLLCLLLLALRFPFLAEAADHDWQIGVSASYSSGDYGTGSTTTITSVPLTLRRLFRDGDIRLTIPYISVTGDCSVTLVAGVPNRTEGTCPTETRVIRRGNQIRVQRRVRQTRTTNGGIGDIVLQGRYYILDENRLLPTVAVTGRIKFPTADPDRGLGTGEFDEGAGIEISKQLFRNVLGFVDGGYTIIGKPEDVPLRNQWYYDLGLGYSFTENLLGSIYYEEYRAVIAGTENPRDVFLALNYKLTPELRLSASYLIGLSDGAPDYAISGGIAYRF